MELEIRLREDRSLVDYDRELYPELMTLLNLSREDHRPEATDTTTPRTVLHMCTQQLQIMESVFLAVKLDRYHAHPLNRGWMNLFRRWSGNPTMGLLWPSLKSTYSKDFVAFADYQLNFTWMDSLPIRHPAGSFPLAGLFALRDPGRAAVLRSPLISIQRLFRELGQEWPIKDDSQDSMYFDPFVASSEIWTISHPYAVLEEIWGIALIAPHPERPAFQRVMIWVRPAYRGVGLGKKLLAVLLTGRPGVEQVHEDVQRILAERKRRLLIVLPPLWRDKPGYRDEMAGWLRFYERQGFVRTTVQEAKQLLRWDSEDVQFNPEAFCLVMPESIRNFHRAEHGA